MLYDKENDKFVRYKYTAIFIDCSGDKGFKKHKKRQPFSRLPFW